MGRPRLIVEATAASPLMRAIQTAYNTAGKPDLRALAKASGVSYGALHSALRAGKAPKQVELIERTLAALGFEVQVRYVRPCQVDSPSSDSASPVQG